MAIMLKIILNTNLSRKKMEEELLKEVYIYLIKN
jgi:hypothetical protein